MEKKFKPCLSEVIVLETHLLSTFFSEKQLFPCWLWWTSDEYSKYVRGYQRLYDSVIGSIHVGV